MSAIDRARRRVIRGSFHAAMHGIATISTFSRDLRPGPNGIAVARDVRYGRVGPRDPRLDVYVPPGPGPFPVVVYLHGGGFSIGSKGTHRALATWIARQGFVVVNVDYRLAPKHPFPAAIEDACSAYLWVVENVSRFAGDPRRLVVAGESAGANLTLALALACTTRRPEPWARAVFERGVVPRVLLPLSGYLQVHDPDRFARASKVNPFYLDRMRAVSASYLEHATPSHGFDLADPLLVLERGDVLERPWPPTYASVGGADPILDDTVRLGRVLEQRATVSRIRVHPGQPHAFQVGVIRGVARASWDEALAFARSHLD